MPGWEPEVLCTASALLERARRKYESPASASRPCPSPRALFLFLPLLLPGRWAGGEALRGRGPVD